MHTHDPNAIKVSIVIPVYCDADRAIGLVCSLKMQKLPTGTDVEIIIVDDGSGDDTAALIEQATGNDVNLQRLPANRGRAVARNVGAAQASGKKILFMDCDCLPGDDNMIGAHLLGWNSGMAASIGPVVGNNGFWHRYQTAASERRARQHAVGISFIGSSQNMMVSTAVFKACGGFDDAYESYGFEDRDLQLRIAQYGRIAWAADASVRHMDALSMVTVSGKMAEAGGSSAVLFARRHPEAYLQLGYAALDARTHRWLRLPARLLGYLIEPMARAVDRVIAMPILPYALKSGMVKILSALSFLVGTAR